jgi:putative addiction module CopG family antidote
MAIQLKPELEALIQEDVAQGPYRSADEFLEHDVHMLHDQENWLRENRAEIAAKIEQGFASAELADAAQVRARMDERKRAWLQTRQ